MPIGTIRVSHRFVSIIHQCFIIQLEQCACVSISLTFEQWKSSLFCICMCHFAWWIKKEKKPKTETKKKKEEKFFIFPSSLISASDLVNFIVIITTNSILTPTRNNSQTWSFFQIDRTFLAIRRSNIKINCCDSFSFQLSVFRSKTISIRTNRLFFFSLATFFSHIPMCVVRVIKFSYSTKI